MNNTNIIKSHPRGLFTLIFTGFWERFSFYGTLTILLLYLTQFFSFSNANAYATWGAFIALGYITPAIGGLLADYALGFERTLIIGSILMIVGYVLLVFQTNFLFYIGISLLLCGSGLFKGTISSMIGMLYSDGDIKRHDAYSKYFIGMSIGAILGPFIFGLIIIYFHWWTAFLLSAIGNLLGFAVFIIDHKKFDYQSLPKPPQILANRLVAFFTVKHGLYLGLILTVILVSALFVNPIFGNNFMGILSISAMLIAVFLTLKGSLINAKKVIGLTLLNLLLVCYYAAIFQINGSLIVGIEKEFQMTLLGWVIPPTTFASIQALFAIILTPFLSRLWMYISQEYFETSLLFKIGIGLLCAGVGFGLLAFVFVNKSYPLLSITLANVFLGISTATIMPAHLTAVSQYAPAHLQGTLMGISYLSDALGGFIGSNMTKYAYSFSYFIQNPSIYANTYISIAILMLCLTLVWILMTSLLNFLFGSFNKKDKYLTS